MCIDIEWVSFIGVAKHVAPLELIVRHVFHRLLREG